MRTQLFATPDPRHADMAILPTGETISNAAALRRGYVIRADVSPISASAQKTCNR